MMRNEKSTPKEVTLAEILDERERRAKMQTRLLSEYGVTLISFTMNIAGPIKNSLLIERAFRYGLSELFNHLPNERIRYTYSSSEDCGCVAFILVDMPAGSVKDICVNIEQSCPLGRLFDMDVLGTDGVKLERENERGCIVCGRLGHTCAAGRVHPVRDLIEISTKIMSDHFAVYDAKVIGKTATESLIREVETTPKPGLVDLRNNGSHTDMDVNTFRRSALALEPYFTECVKIGIDSAVDSQTRTFDRLRAAGIKAEKVMLTETSGINTHKGLIYSMGVLLGAIGRLWSADFPIADMRRILDEAAELVKESTVHDFDSASGKTAGEKLYLDRGIKGIRGEVAAGFPSVLKHSLPVYETSLSKGMSTNDAAICALMNLIATVDDTNVYHRGGDEGARFAKEYAKKMTERELSICAIEEMDDEFIKRRLSPGGSADLLAITYFLSSINDIK